MFGVISKKVSAPFLATTAETSPPESPTAVMKMLYGLCLLHVRHALVIPSDPLSPYFARYRRTRPVPESGRFGGAPYTGRAFRTISWGAQERGEAFCRS